MYVNEKMYLFDKATAVKFREMLKSLVGYFWCYPDNHEEEIISPISIIEIEEKYREGVILGKETSVMSFPPALYEGEFVKLSTGEVGCVVEDKRDAMRIAIKTKSNRTFLASDFDNQLYYNGPVSSEDVISVDKVGRLKIDGSFNWYWNRDDVPEMDMEELALIFNEKFCVSF